MAIQVLQYVDKILESIDDYINDNSPSLKANDLYEFYMSLFIRLKGFFGGSWGFDGITEVLIFRTLHHLIGEKETRIKITNDLNAFNLVYSMNFMEVIKSKAYIHYSWFSLDNQEKYSITCL